MSAGERGPVIAWDSTAPPPPVASQLPCERVHLFPPTDYRASWSELPIDNQVRRAAQVPAAGQDGEEGAEKPAQCEELEFSNWVLKVEKQARKEKKKALLKEKAAQRKVQEEKSERMERSKEDSAEWQRSIRARREEDECTASLLKMVSRMEWIKEKNFVRPAGVATGDWEKMEEARKKAIAKETKQFRRDIARLRVVFLKDAQRSAEGTSAHMVNMGELRDNIIERQAVREEEFKAYKREITQRTARRVEELKRGFEEEKEALLRKKKLEDKRAFLLQKRQNAYMKPTTRQKVLAKKDRSIMKVVHASEKALDARLPARQVKSPWKPAGVPTKSKLAALKTDLNTSRESIDSVRDEHAPPSDEDLERIAMELLMSDGLVKKIKDELKESLREFAVKRKSTAFINYNDVHGHKYGHATNHPDLSAFAESDSDLDESVAAQLKSRVLGGSLVSTHPDARTRQLVVGDTDDVGDDDFETDEDDGEAADQGQGPMVVITRDEPHDDLSDVFEGLSSSSDGGGGGGEGAEYVESATSFHTVESSVPARDASSSAGTAGQERQQEGPVVVQEEQSVQVVQKQAALHVLEKKTLTVNRSSFKDEQVEEVEDDGDLSIGSSIDLEQSQLLTMDFHTLKDPLKDTPKDSRDFEL